MLCLLHSSWKEEVEDAMGAFGWIWCWLVAEEWASCVRRESKGKSFPCPCFGSVIVTVGFFLECFHDHWSPCQHPLHKIRVLDTPWFAEVGQVPIKCLIVARIRQRGEPKCSQEFLNRSRPNGFLSGVKSSIKGKGGQWLKRQKKLIQFMVQTHDLLIEPNLLILNGMVLEMMRGMM